MRILAFVHDHYGKRIVDNISSRAPSSWEVSSITAPRSLPPIVDEPLEFLSPELPQADLVLHLAETARAAQLLPGLVFLTKAKVVIAPVDSEAWLPSGLRLQLQRELAEQGVEIHFPKPFCSLNTAAWLDKTRDAPPHPILQEFARYFGRPSLEIVLEEDGETIHELIVERGAPCGSSQYAAKRIAGLKMREAVPQGGLICLHYPCLASMQPKTTDEGVETLMHTSGIIYNESLSRAIESVLSSVNLKDQSKTSDG
ncbi:MAG: DUF166 family protein [Anaerolineales bacterium]